MTLFMPPIQRKKKVEDRHCPDSFRVISEEAISDHPKFKPTSYTASFEPRTPTPKAPTCVGNEDHPFVEPARILKSTRVLPQALPDYRGNKPQPLSCGFLDKDVRFLNEPICNVYTRDVRHEEKQWWPSRPNENEIIVPPYAADTNYRINYSCNHGDRHTGSGRHSFNVNRESAKGVVPVSYLRGENDAKRFYKEGMSYEHIYNSRSDPNYPIRGRRQGSFVWNRMDPISQKKFIEYHEKLNEEERKFEELKAIKNKNTSDGNGVCVKKLSPTAFTTAKLVTTEPTANCKHDNLSAQDRTSDERCVNKLESNQEDLSSGNKQKTAVNDQIALEDHKE